MAEPMDIKVDMTSLTWGDMEALGKGGLSLTEQLNIMDRVVVGGCRHLPYLASRDAIMRAISEAMSGTDEPGKTLSGA